MIADRDEYLHELSKSSDELESYFLTFFDKKNKVSGTVEIYLSVKTAKMFLEWTINVGNETFHYLNEAPFPDKPDAKIITDKKLKYKIVTPQEKIQISLLSDQITAELNLTSMGPVYKFPEKAIITDSVENKSVEHDIWQQYQQRCKVSGNISVKKGTLKGTKKSVECTGQRMHLWGAFPWSKIQQVSNVTVQFREYSMNLYYADLGDYIFSHGFISRKSSNIPIMNIEPELYTFANKKADLKSSEFFYTDSQDDRDLVVSRSIQNYPLNIPFNKKKINRFQSVSEFTVIGTNKKGIGWENHLFAQARLTQLD